MGKRRMTMAILLFALLALVLALAWYDGGREEQRMIIEPVELPLSGAAGAGQ